MPPRECLCTVVHGNLKKLRLRAQQKNGDAARNRKTVGRGYAVKSYASDHGILTDAAGDWTPTDDACLLVLGRQGLSVDDMSALIGRSTQAIRGRLVRLGLKLSRLRELGPVAAP
ncbi:MAG: hypothetical protein IPO66_18395 [Rhodanobacteraceae bacterium]|nr:hypothetical protein [Rhodanobacteraceae bacterium]